MAEHASETLTIRATPHEVWQAATDLERYPDWSGDITKVTVTSRDGEGRPVEADFWASAFGRHTHYRLRYDYTEAPNRLVWTLIEGDIQKSIDGMFTFTVDPDGWTTTRYDLAIDLVIPLPGFLKRRAERRILSALAELKTHIES